ncbi:MAG: hypothetical protein DMD86_18625 [Candidatus Rokuibacteriota bacterium]|nr:MAG: hypothetical protein DMD86_18625 [Candidatus Rokubacteria bacterium]
MMWPALWLPAEFLVIVMACASAAAATRLPERFPRWAVRRLVPSASRSVPVTKSAGGCHGR